MKNQKILKGKMSTEISSYPAVTLSCPALSQPKTNSAQTRRRQAQTGSKKRGNMHQASTTLQLGLNSENANPAI